jgi:hypothetical protein
LADFGVAKMLSGESFTATGGFVGSANFASPEQVKNEPLSPASDVYALTAVLFQCLTGAVPYPRDSEASVLEAHLNEPPPRFPDGASSQFHELLARGMAKLPAERFASAGELLEAVGVCVDEMPGFMRRRVPAFPAKGSGTTRAEMIIVSSELKTKGPGGPRSTPYPAPVFDPPTVFGKTGFSGRVAGKAVVGDTATGKTVVGRAPRRTWPRRRSLTAIGLGVLLVLGAAVWLALGSGSGGGPLAATLRSGPLAIQSGAGWRSSDFRLEGLDLSSAVAANVDGTQVVAGTIASPVPAPADIPTSLRRAYGTPSSTGIVRPSLGAAKQYTWSGQRVAPLRVIVIATSKGEVAVACSAASLGEAGRMSAACGQVIERVRIEGASVEYPGADPTVVDALNSALSARAQASTADFGSSETALQSRAASLAGLARAIRRADSHLPAGNYGRYARDLSALSVALTSEASRVERISRDAAAGNRGAYGKDRSSLAQVTAHVRAAADAFSRFGITPPAVPTVRLPGVPKKSTAATGSSTETPTATTGESGSIAAHPSAGGGRGEVGESATGEEAEKG